jgi:serine/threonine-protein kinase CLA4
MKGVRDEYVVGMDALYVDLVEDSLWIRMELMERILANVVSQR